MHEFAVGSGRVALGEGWAECNIGIDGGRTFNKPVEGTTSWLDI
jgi:hypothetical protein